MHGFVYTLNIPDCLHILARSAETAFLSWEKEDSKESCFTSVDMSLVRSHFSFPLY